MKYKMVIPEMVFNKMKNEGRKTDIHLLDKQCQQIKVHDLIEYVGDYSGQRMLRKVKGMAFFDNFEDMVDSLPPQIFGYDNKEEILVRLNRLYLKERQAEFNVLLLFVVEDSNAISDFSRDSKVR